MTKKIAGGATIWARQTIESDIFYWKPDKWFKIWFYIVNKVNHKNTKLFKRGSNFITYKEISIATQATENQIDGFMRYAKEQLMLTTQKTTRGMIVIVLKYDFFQDLNNYKNDTENETETKQKRNTYDTINNNDNNDKNEKNLVPKGTSEQNSQIKQIMEIFYKINPTLNWGNKTQRNAVADLIKLFGLGGTLKMAEQIVAVQGEKYAPVATTPYQMKEKLAQFKVYFDKEKSKRREVFEV